MISLDRGTSGEPVDGMLSSHKDIQGMTNASILYIGNILYNNFYFWILTIFPSYVHLLI